MKGTAVFKALGPIDMRNVGRDEMLRWMIFLPLLLALLMRFGWPLLVRQLQISYQFDLAPYTPLLLSFLTIGIPAVFGMVIGFLLLDERDEGSLIGLQVTPLSLNNYLVYRLGMPIVFTLLLVLVGLPLAGITTFSLGQLVLLALVSAPMAPLLAVFLAAFASNKVQGFALSKAAGTFFVVPLAAYFLGGTWQWVLGLLPTFWAPKLYWLLSKNAPSAWLVGLLGLVYQLVWVYLLARRFNKKLHE